MISGLRALIQRQRRSMKIGISVAIAAALATSYVLAATFNGQPGFDISYYGVTNFNDGFSTIHMGTYAVNGGSTGFCLDPGGARPDPVNHPFVAINWPQPSAARMAPNWSVKYPTVPLPVMAWLAGK